MFERHVTTAGIEPAYRDALHAERLTVQRYLDALRVVAMIVWTSLALFFGDSVEYVDWKIQRLYLAG